MNVVVAKSTEQGTVWRRARGFAFDVVALGILIAGTAVAALYLMAVWHGHDVSEVHGLALRIAAVDFFFRVFQFHVAGVILVGGLIAWRIRHERIALFNVVVAFVLLVPLLRTYFPKSPPPVVGTSLKIYSANLYSMNRDGESILGSIRTENPDVIVLMEVTNWSYALLSKEFGKSHPYQHRPFYNGGGLVLSRLPFREEVPTVRFSGNHTRVPLVFTIDGREFSMYPVHLLSPGKLSLIAQNREQVREFLQIDANDPRPMIIVGDCNMTPLTSNFAALRDAGFRSTYELIGLGACNTWGPRWWPRLNQLPGVQIDQMLIQPPLTARSHHVGLDTGSDHRPIVAEIGFAEQ